MRRSGGNFGIVILVVVLAVVLLLAVKAWENVMPATSALSGTGSTAAVSDHGQPEAVEEARSSDLPDLTDMRDSTSEHADQVREALETID